MKLYYAIVFLVILFVLKAIYNRIRATVLRALLYMKLKKICKKRGFEFTAPRFIFASFFRLSTKPDIVIKTPDEDLIVRIITCFARKRTYHFVNHEWFVRVFKYFLLSLAFHSGEPLTLSRRVLRLPPTDEEFLRPDGRKKQEILLFSPSPLEITFNTSSNRREIASNGTDFEAWLVFNGKGFEGEVEGRSRDR